MEERGINTVNEALQRLTSNGSGTLNNAWNGGGGNFASGGSAPSLRGLTVQATLTVFDGQRMAVYPFADDGHRNFVDLNTIPTASIDRIEVLKDGASSTYGADAIAGVVNVITKKEITGFHADVSGGTATTADAGDERRFRRQLGHGQPEFRRLQFLCRRRIPAVRSDLGADLNYPANSVNLSNICDAAGHCMTNAGIFGITNGVDDNGVPFSVLSGSTTSYAPVLLRGLDGRVDFLDELDLGPLQVGVQLLDVCLVEVDLRHCRRDLGEGEDADLLPFEQEALDFLEFCEIHY